MTGDVIPINRGLVVPSQYLVDSLQAIGIAPNDLTIIDCVDTGLISNTFDIIGGYVTDDTSIYRIEQVRQEQRFRFSIETEKHVEQEDAEMLGYRPELVIESPHSSNFSDVLAIHINPATIGRFLSPIGSLARACELVSEEDPEEKNHDKVVKVAVSSAMAMALSYTAFCEFGNFDTSNPLMPLPDLDAIAEESGMCKKDSDPSGVVLREVGLRFAGSVSMRYMAMLVEETFGNVEEPGALRISNAIKYGIILKSMALNDKVINHRGVDQPVSFALEHAYTARQIARVSNLWFRVTR